MDDHDLVLERIANEKEISRLNAVVADLQAENARLADDVLAYRAVCQDTYNMLSLMSEHAESAPTVYHPGNIRLSCSRDVLDTLLDNLNFMLTGQRKHRS